MKPGKIEVASSQGTYVIRLSGDVRLTMCSSFERYLDNMFMDEDFHTVLVDLSATEGIDSTTLGQLAKISIISKDRYQFVPSIITPQQDITRILLSMGFDKVFHLIRQSSQQVADFNELECGELNEGTMKHQIIDAHKALMSLNDNNKMAFQELVDSLEVKAHR